MKKVNFLLATAVMLGFASCSNEEIPAPVANGDAVTITVSLPAEMASRAVSDGLTATNLTYAIYDGEALLETNQGDATKAVTFTNREATFTANLVKGQKYTMVFWADAPGNTHYTFSATEKTVTVNYGTKGNDETRDAFYGVQPIVVDGNPVSATLRRPFAQVNVGASDYEAAAAKIDHTKITLSGAGVHNTLNLLTGEATGTATITYDNVALDLTGETFPYTDPAGKKTYTYIAMNYILTGSMILDENVQQAQSELVDVTFSATDKDSNEMTTFTKTGVPVQRNYQTNLFGELFTTDVKVNITIDENYYNPDKNQSIDVKTFTNLITKGGSMTATEDFELSSGTNPNAAYAFAKDAEINLDGHTLTLGNRVSVKNGATVTFTNGTVKFERAQLGKNFLQPEFAGKLILDGVTLDAGEASAIIAYDEGTVVTIKNSTIKAGYYAVSTNASYPGKQTINIENSILETTHADGTPLLYNNGSTIIAKGCTFKGNKRAAFGRTGNFTFTDCKFVSTTGALVADQTDHFVSGNWGSGTEVFYAPLVFGNRDKATATTYGNCGVTVTFTNCEIESPAEEGTYLLYVWGQTADKNATVTGTLKGIAPAQIFAGDNATVTINQ